MGMGSQGEGEKASNIDYCGGSAASKQAKKASSERRKGRKGRRPKVEMGGGLPLFGDLSMAPLAQAFKDGESTPPAGADLALVFTPAVLQHLFGGPVTWSGREVPRAKAITNLFCWSCHRWSRA
jgi:hypothetical protein